nr:PREDICTED: complement C2-like [Lepisosteus oculatus]
MNFLKAQDEKKFKDIRHVIILFTDGRANMGGNPVEVVRKIKELVYALREENKEDYLGERDTSQEEARLAATSNPRLKTPHPGAPEGLSSALRACDL